MSPQPQRSNEFRQARQERLRAIELQIAQQGEAYAPPHLIVEREALEREIAATDAALNPDNSRAALIKEMSDVQRTLYIERIVMDTQVRVLEVGQQVQREAGLREVRQKETDTQRQRTQRWLAWLTSAIAALIGFRVRDLWREWMQR